MNWLALDIGGANLKVADGVSFARSQAFALWKYPEKLPGAIAALLSESPRADHLAVTMTGELSDCFRTKQEGVTAIAEATLAAAGDRTVIFYLTDGSLVAAEHALKHPMQAAASNWHVLARFAASFVPSGSGLLLDIGSTTTDVIPLADGQPVGQGFTDTERLLHGELVYTGVQRSPICALVREAPWRGQMCPVSQELFATSWDVYLMLEDLAEEPSSVHTADGRPATRSAARDRLARMICADRDLFTEQDALILAKAVAEAQLEMIASAARRVVEHLPSPPETVVISGSGEFLARRVVERLGWECRLVSLSTELGPNLSSCAPAHALAVIARETYSQ